MARLRVLLFLSTLSLRRATVLTRIDTGNSTDFYPRSPCGERPVTTLGAGSVRDFYPRSPCGERPNPKVRLSLTIMISIHALLAESDMNHFGVCMAHKLFLSTLSLRRATWRLLLFRQSDLQFLSTLSLRRATADLVQKNAPKWLFLSTLSLRRATV